MPEIPGLTSGLPRVMEGLCGGASVPRPCRIMSLESAPDRSYDVPPADERKGKTKAESDRHLGNPTVTHRSTMIRYPAGAKFGRMSAPRVPQRLQTSRGSRSESRHHRPRAIPVRGPCNAVLRR
jgi:hypothetical protein